MDCKITQFGFLMWTLIRHTHYLTLLCQVHIVDLEQAIYDTAFSQNNSKTGCRSLLVVKMKCVCFAIMRLKCDGETLVELK